MKCRGCRYCMKNDKGDRVCADLYYGQVVTVTLDRKKDCYVEGWNDFLKRMKKMEKENKELHDKIIYGI